MQQIPQPRSNSPLSAFLHHRVVARNPLRIRWLSEYQLRTQGPRVSRIRVDFEFSVFVTIFPRVFSACSVNIVTGLSASANNYSGSTMPVMVARREPSPLTPPTCSPSNRGRSKGGRIRRGWFHCNRTPHGIGIRSLFECFLSWAFSAPPCGIPNRCQNPRCERGDRTKSHGFRLFNATP